MKKLKKNKIIEIKEGYKKKGGINVSIPNITPPPPPPIKPNKPPKD